MTRMLDLIPRTSFTFPARDMFDRFFEDGSLRTFSGEEKSWIPAFDISENDKEYAVVAELPGIDEKDLEVTLSDGILSVKGEKKQEKEEKDEMYHRVERCYGSFQRSFRIPGNVEDDKVDAIYKDGVLKLTIPKSEEKKAKKIEIKH